MIYQDETCVCRDCARTFTFSAEQQEEFAKRGFSPPARCPECQKARNSKRRENRISSRQTYTAPCATCGKDATIPFKPTGSKPVYCTDCYQAKLAETKTVSDVAPAPQEEPAPVTEAPAVQVCDETASFGGFELDARLERAVREAGYETPTPVQTATIPVLMSGRDLIGTAQTGTGKTAAFVLPILQHLLSNPTDRPCTRVIVLAPTRELAEQVGDTFKALARYTKIKTATVYGGVGMSPQERALRTGAEVIVACPGRLLDHMDRGNTNFSKVEKLVLDEADRMLDMGFLPSIKRILSSLPNRRHSMLFSATFASELDQLAKNAMNNPQRVDCDICAPAKTVAHALYPCPQHLKTSLVLKLLADTDTNSVLIFTRTKHRADRLAQQIQRAGYETAALHADRSQNQRTSALDDFRMGKRQILVATDIAARGLDVESISHVINYDIPDTVDAYIHRIGRTGRMEREGDALTLVTKEDYPIVWDIEKALGCSIERRTLGDFDYYASAPSTEDFRRGPAPRHSSTPQVARVISVAKLQPSGSSNAPASKRSSGYYASKRRSRAGKSGA